MWLRIVLTASALGIVLYLQFGLRVGDWLPQPAAETANTAGQP